MEGTEQEMGRSEGKKKSVCPQHLFSQLRDMMNSWLNFAPFEQNEISSVFCSNLWDRPTKELMEILHITAKQAA